jgi:hypothetical protein
VIDLEDHPMLPPILEIHVAWHPDDLDGEQIAIDLAAHFHDGAYASMLGGAVEVYVRSQGWRALDDAPRPVVFAGSTDAAGIAAAQCVAVVPVLGVELARAVQRPGSAWAGWLQVALDAARADPAHVRVLPLRLEGFELQGALAKMMPPKQLIAEPDPLDRQREGHGESAGETLAALRRRDLVQALAQWLSPDGSDRLTVFVSHTKRLNGSDEPVTELVDVVLQVLQRGRIGSFYDAHDLQPGEDWNTALREGAGTCAVLALRTDLYASRDWCQREVLLAKQGGMPVVMLDALTDGETRGSFLLDHVPKLPVRRSPGGEWQADSVRRAVQMLADAWLHRALWLRQENAARATAPYGAYDWLPAAPEPCTLLPRLIELASDGIADPPVLRLLHPDPPLASEEARMLQLLAQLAGLASTLDITTPRLLASRGA